MKRFHWVILGLLVAGVAAPPALAQTQRDPHARAYQDSMNPHLTRQEALTRAEEHLQAMGPAGARLGRVEESDVLVEAEVVAPDGGRTGRIVVDRRTGWVRTEP